MTSILQAIVQQLISLKSLIEKMDREAYCFPCELLSKASVGEHSRHVIELVQCLVNGYADGVISYDKRKRDKEMETNPVFAAGIITTLLPLLHKPDKVILLEAGFGNSGDQPVAVNSSYKREIIYNIEHAVHHLALIKVGLKEMGIEPGDETIGVAYATLQYRKICAQ